MPHFYLCCWKSFFGGSNARVFMSSTYSYGPGLAIIMYYDALISKISNCVSMSEMQLHFSYYECADIIMLKDLMELPYYEKAQR